MSLKVLYVFGLILLSQTYAYLENDLPKIKDNYCEEYCAGKCVGSKMCQKLENRIITDEYTITLDSELQIELNSNFKLKSLMPLGSLNETLHALLVVNKNSSTFEMGIKYLQQLGFGKIDDFTNTFPISESENTTVLETDLVITANGPKYVSIRLYGGEKFFNQILNDYIPKLGNTPELITIVGNGGIMSLSENVFQGKNNLKSLVFGFFQTDNLSSAIFENLINLEGLFFVNMTTMNQSLFNSDFLQRNLKTVVFSNDTEIDLAHFQNYEKLQFIFMKSQSFIPNNNIKAFICAIEDPVNCNFTVDIHGRRCPDKCKCVTDISGSLDDLDESEDFDFHINCTGSGLVQIPELPVPIAGNSILDFEACNLRQLPNNSLPGYANLAGLHLANNNLTSLSLNQLPPNITHLDIRNNKLTSLDTEVIQFFNDRFTKEGGLVIKMSGNSWQLSCESMELLYLLQQQDPKEYAIVLKNNKHLENCSRNW